MLRLLIRALNEILIMFRHIMFQQLAFVLIRMLAWTAARP